MFAMFLWDWFISFLEFLGLLRKACKVVVLGLDNAGKTTLLNAIKPDGNELVVPTQYAHSEELRVGRLTIATFDLTSPYAVFRVLKENMKINAVVFMIDATDRERFFLAKHELEWVLSDLQLANCPLLILANKTDNENAATEEEIRSSFELNGLTTGKETTPTASQRAVELFTCSVVNKTRYGIGLYWLAKHTCCSSFSNFLES